jgi:hypothetical protein
MDALTIVGLSIVGCVTFLCTIVSAGYVWLQRTIYVQNQLNYRANLKAQTSAVAGGDSPQFDPLTQILQMAASNPEIVKRFMGTMNVPKQDDQIK